MRESMRPPECNPYELHEGHPHHICGDKVTIHGQLHFPLTEGQQGEPVPFHFEIPLEQKIITDITIPGPVVNYEICSDTLHSAKLALIQVVESANDATVTLNNGTPLPLKGKNLPIYSEMVDPVWFSPGLILYCNISGGLTSIKFSSAQCMKVKVYVFGE